MSYYKPHPTLVLEDHTPKRSRFPVVDIHNHLGYPEQITTQGILTGGDWTVKNVSTIVDLMDQLNIRCIVNLDGGWGNQLCRNLEHYKEPYPDRFCIFAWVDWSQVKEHGFGEKWARELEKSVALGAQGLKVFKTLGLGYRDRNGNLISVDDPRLDPVWAKAGELKIPVLIHSSDPVAFFLPLDQLNERWDELKEHPEWHYFGKGFPQFIEPIEAQLRVVARHQQTTFISAHVLSYAENLSYVAAALDRFPNLYVDIGERVGELGRQPYSARRFLINYADRVLFGTDIPPQRSIYEIYFRFLETDDEYFDYGRNQGRYRIYGVFLPDNVLSQIYYQNAHKLLLGLKG